MRKLTEQEQKREKKLLDILERLEAGEHIQNRKLETWLTEDEFDSISTYNDHAKDFNSKFDHKPDEIKDYESILKKGNFAYNRAEGYSRKGNKQTAKKFYNEAEEIFESAIERAQEIIDSDPEMRVWFDRDPDCGGSGEASLDPVGIPRAVTSRSLDNQGGCKMPILKKKEVKTKVVQQALEDLQREPLTQAEIDEQNALIAEKLKQLREDMAK